MFSVMDGVSNEGVTIIDKDLTSNTVCHVVDGFLLEESNEPFPVSYCILVQCNTSYNPDRIKLSSTVEIIAF